MRYQLWDQEHGNMIADFDELADALMTVRDEVAERGPDVTRTMALLHVTADRSSLEPVAQGDVLLELSRLPLVAR